MSTTLDRRWMSRAERLSREDAQAQGSSYGMVYYRGGGVYSTGWGISKRGAAEAREWLESREPDFARRVSLDLGTIDRTNGGRA